MARLGLPALGALVFLIILVVGTARWVVRSDARTERVSRVLLAWRGNASCLAPGALAAARPARAAGTGRGAREPPTARAVATAYWPF